MDTLRPKNWAKFQHYKDRNPPWIKLHREILDDFDYSSLPLASKALAPLLWLLAAENMQGDIPADPARLAHRLRWPLEDVIAGLKPLLHNGFFVSASGVLAECLHVAIPETETEGETKKKRLTSPLRGSRLPKDWFPSDEQKAYAESQGVSVALETENFRDYWHAKAGKDACKTDWGLTWKTWVRRAPKAKDKPAPSVPQTKTVKEALAPSESPTEKRRARIWQDFHYGQFDVTERDRQLAELERS